MKKKLVSISLVLLMLSSLTACSLIPNVGNSEEDNGDIVASTEDTSGNQTEVCDHQWIEATCTEPKTCSICGITEGDPLGHDFAPATVDSPKKCRVCGIEEGDKIKVKSGIEPSLDEILNYNVIDEICVNAEFENDRLHVYVYDLDMNLLYEEYLAVPDGFDLNKSYNCLFAYDLGLFYYFSMNENKRYLEVYKVTENGLEQIFESEVLTEANYDPENKDLKAIGNEKYYGASGYGCSFVYDIENNCLCSEEDIEEDEIDYDESLWSYYAYNASIDGYMVGTKDKSSWGYLDKDGNEIAMYADASDFSPNGYALVSEDGTTYSIIDKDFNIVGEGLFEGVSACWDSNYNAFFIEQADESWIYVIIE